jgi:hypothetical protein
MVGAIFCDLEKAFNSVNHDILLSKLTYYGATHNAKLLLESHLSDRHQRVQIINSNLNQNTVSKWAKVRYNFPLGSVLGLLLYLLYMNDLLKVTESKATSVLFADNTSILTTSPNTTKLLNDINIIFKQINIWFEANLLSMNLDKTTTDICVKYDKQISNTTNIKFLGLFINDTVSWKTYVSILYLN